MDKIIPLWKLNYFTKVRKYRNEICNR